MNRTELTQNQKYLGFKKAFSTYNSHLKNENYIAAYVIGFSILEDRINALYHTRKKFEKETVKGHINHYPKINYLLKKNDITSEESTGWKSEGDKRNKKIHAAMWNIDEFSKADCERVIKYARQADKARRKQKSELGL